MCVVVRVVSVSGVIFVSVVMGLPPLSCNMDPTASSVPSSPAGTSSHPCSLVVTGKTSDKCVDGTKVDSVEVCCSCDEV